jgi:hypothetical protein
MLANLAHAFSDEDLVDKLRGPLSPLQIHRLLVEAAIE